MSGGPTPEQLAEFDRAGFLVIPRFFEAAEYTELRRATESQGFVLRERLAIYPEFATRAEYLDEGLRARVQALVDERGLVKESHERWRRW